MPQGTALRRAVPGAPVWPVPRSHREGSAEVAARVAAARQRQSTRYDDAGARRRPLNVDATGDDLAAHATPDEAGQALGYPQLFDWLASGRPRPLEEVVTKIQTLTRRFARRQLTWIRNLQESDRREECGQGSVHAVEVAEGEEPLGHLDDVLLSLE